MQNGPAIICPLASLWHYADGARAHVHMQCREWLKTWHLSYSLLIASMIHLVHVFAWPFMSLAVSVRSSRVRGELSPCVGCVQCLFAFFYSTAARH